MGSPSGLPARLLPREIGGERIRKGKHALSVTPGARGQHAGGLSGEASVASRWQGAAQCQHPKLGQDPLAVRVAGEGIHAALYDP